MTAHSTGGEYRIQVASEAILCVQSSIAVRNLRASRSSSRCESPSAARHSGLSHARGTRTMRNAEIATAVSEITPSELHRECSSRPSWPPWTARMRPSLSLTSVNTASACSTTAAVHAPNTDASGIAVVEPYGRLARSERSTRVHLASVRGDRLLRPTSSVRRSSSDVHARAASTGRHLKPIPVPSTIRSPCSRSGAARRST